MLKMILPVTGLMLASVTGAFAQQGQYDRTGDHMMSYGAVPANPASTPAPTPAPRAARHSRQQPASPNVPLDRTGDHMNSYGPVQQ